MCGEGRQSCAPGVTYFILFFILYAPLQKMCGEGRQSCAPGVYRAEIWAASQAPPSEKEKKITLFWAPSRALPSWGKFSSDFHFRDFFLSCFKSTAVLGEVLKSQRPNISTLWSRYVLTFQNVCLGGCSEWQPSSLFLLFLFFNTFTFQNVCLGRCREWEPVGH